MKDDAEFVRSIITGQFEAALAMLGECLEKCPDAQWDGLIAKYPFWMVAYHTLYMVDLRLSASEEAFTPQVEFHPLGMKEIEEEYPSRRFSREELLRYLAACREKLGATMAGETAETLRGASGFPSLKFSRAEAHIHGLRHVQHHAGQLGAFLRKAGVDLGWVRSGWR